MSLRSSVWARELIGVSPVAKLIALDLADCSGTEEIGGRLVKEIAEFCCCSADEVIVASDELIEHVLFIDFDIEKHRLTIGFPVVETSLEKRDRREQSDTFRSSKPMWLYVITKGQHVKVGITTSVEQRVRSLGTAFPGEVTMILNVKGTARQIRKAEERAHQILSKFCSTGEWFTCDLETALAAARQALTEMGVAIS